MNEQWQINNLISWKRKFKTQKLILRSNSRITLTGSWIRSRKLNQLSTWQEINFKFTFCGFSFTPMSKWRKVHETFLNTKIPFQKRTFYDHRVQNVPQVFSETSLPRLVQTKPSALIRGEENKVGFLEREFESEKLSFVHKEESEHSFELSLSTRVFYRLIFILEMKTLHLKATTWWTRASHFVDGWHLSPPPMWLPIWLLWGSGYGWFILGKNFFPKPLELEFFSLTYNGVSFFSALYTLWGKFFSVQDINFLGWIVYHFR